MKIVSVDIMTLEAEAPANRAICRPVYCRIHTDEGIYGDGEAGVMLMTGAFAAYEMLKELSGQLIGLDPLDNVVIVEKMIRHTYFAPNGGPIIGAAIAAIDTALWDIKGKFFQVPVYKLLGGKHNDDLRCYASQINYGWGSRQEIAVSLEDFAACAQEAVDQGYDAIKADFFVNDADGKMLTDKERKGFLSEKYLQLVEDRVAIVRDTIGPNRDIIVECHGYTDTLAAEQIAHRIEKYNILYFEEPNSGEVPTLKKLGNKINLPISVGERLHSKMEFLPHILQQTIQVAQPDIGNCRGITEAVKIAELAAMFDIGIQFHCANSPICTAATLQVEANLSNIVFHEHCCVQERNYIRKLAKYDYQPVNGRIAIPALPGIGNELSEYALNHCEKTTVK